MKRFLSILLSSMILLCAIPVLAFAPQEMSVILIYTHDIHSYFEPHTTQIGDDIIEVGGFARRKTLIDEVKNTCNATFILDAGDFSMGTLIQTVYKERASELVLMGELGYDAATVGNHELDYRDHGFAQMLQTAIQYAVPLPQLVMTNLLAPDNTIQAALDAYGVKPYVIVEHGGVRMAILGLMGKDSLETAPMTQFQWEPMADAAKRTIKQIKENETVDIIVALSHAGTSSDSSKSEDELLAKAVPEIDVIISGHTHTLLPEPITIGNTHVVSQGEYGELFSSLNLTRREDGRWDISDYSHRIIDQTVTESERILSLIDQYLLDASELYLSVFGYQLGQFLTFNAQPFGSLREFGKELREELLGNLISDAFRYAVEQAEGDRYEEVTMAITANGLVRGSLMPGEVTVLDAYNISSLGIGADGTPGYPLISVYITGRELKTAAEVDVSVSKLMSSAQLYSSGVYWSFNPKRLILNRVTDVWIEKRDGSREEIDDAKLYRIVTGLYCAQMLSAVESKSFGLLSITPKNKDGSIMTDFEANIIHDSQGRELKEWTAIAGYLSSMGGTVNDYYGTTHGRKLSAPDASIGAWLANPNKVGQIVILIGAVLIALIGYVIYLAITHKRRKMKRLAKKEARAAQIVQ